MSKNTIWLFVICLILFGIFYWMTKPISFPLKLSGENVVKFHVFKDGKYEVSIYAKDNNIEPRCFSRFQQRGFDEYDMEANENSSFEYKILKNGMPLNSEKGARIHRVTSQYGFIFGKFLLMHGDYEVQYGKAYIPCIKNMEGLDLEIVYRETFGSMPLYIIFGERLFFLLALGCLLWGVFGVIKQKAIQ